MLRKGFAGRGVAYIHIKQRREPPANYPAGLRGGGNITNCPPFCQVN